MRNLLMMCAALLLAIPATAQVEEWGKPADLLGKEAPAFKIDLLGGGSLDLEAYKGKKMVVLDFWASWCPWCRQSTEKFVEASKKYADQDVVFYMVAVGEKADVVGDYWQKHKVEAKVALDSERKASDLYWVDLIPHVVFIDKEGKVVQVAVGEDKVGEALDAELEKHFGKTASASEADAPAKG